jgi:hypothetical protein
MKNPSFCRMDNRLKNRPELLYLSWYFFRAFQHSENKTISSMYGCSLSNCIVIRMSSDFRPRLFFNTVAGAYAVSYDDTLDIKALG